MRFNEVFGGVVVRPGNILLSLVLDSPYWHAIIKRESTGEYVYCFAYDITDGTWGNGHYFSSYSDAVSCMCDRLK